MAKLTVKELDRGGLRLERFQKFPGRPTDGDLGPEGIQVPEKGKTRPSDSPSYFVGGVCSMSRSTSSACSA